MTSPPELSVVLACARGSAGAAASLEALKTTCRNMATELIVAHAGEASAADQAGQCGGLPLRRVEGPPDALVPELWALGAEAASGAAIAFTIPECRVPPKWAAGLLDALRSGAAGAGGGFTLADGADMVTRATYFLRYSAFLPTEGIETRNEIAGDNAAYGGAALRSHRESLARGFWEVEFHRLIRGDGGSLVLVPGATATFAGPVRFSAMWRQRLRHGRHFGEWRVRVAGHARWRIVAAVPAVPAVLVARVLRRLRARRGLLRRALPALPVILALAVAWAAGEAAGAWRAAPLVPSSR